MKTRIEITHQTSTHGEGIFYIDHYEDIYITDTEGYVCEQLRGKVETAKKTFSDIEVNYTGLIKKYEVAAIPFTFDIPQNVKFPSYEGHNAFYYFLCEIRVKYTHPNRSKTNNLLSNNKAVADIPIFFDDKQHLYKVKQQKLDFIPTIDLPIWALFMIISLCSFIAIIIAFLKESIEIFYYGISILVINNIILYIIGYFKKSKLILKGQIEHVDDTKFKISIDHITETLELKKLQYEVNEVVVDSRGTSSSTYTNELLLSDFIELDHTKNTFEIPYPQKNHLAFYMGSRVKTEWIIHVICKSTKTNKEVIFYDGISVDRVIQKS